MEEKNKSDTILLKWGVISGYISTLGILIVMLSFLIDIYMLFIIGSMVWYGGLMGICICTITMVLKEDFRLKKIG